MAAATAQGTYINPMAALATQIPHALNGESTHYISHLFLLTPIQINLHFKRFAIVVIRHYTDPMKSVLLRFRAVHYDEPTLENMSV